MKKIGIACDCHNTLINSNHAWIKAFCDYSDYKLQLEISMCLYGKMKRRALAKKYKIPFELVENRADEYEEKNIALIDFLLCAKELNIPLFVVSNAPRKRVLKDMKITGIKNIFKKIYTGNEGGKKNKKIFDEIIKKYNLDYLLFLGNEEFDDHIEHEKVISFALTSFLRDRFEIIGGYCLDDKGKILESKGDYE